MPARELPNLKGCCAWFDSMYRTVGRKGFGLLPAVAFGRRCFLLQARPVEPDDVRELMKPVGPETRPVAIAISMELVLRHCPCCARLLSEVIAEQQAAFDEAAAALRPLYEPA